MLILLTVIYILSTGSCVCTDWRCTSGKHVDVYMLSGVLVFLGGLLFRCWLSGSMVESVTNSVGKVSPVCVRFRAQVVSARMSCAT